MANESTWGKCEKCGQPAIHFLRDTDVTGCVLDSQGQPWVTREPGDLHQYCGGCLPADKIGLVWNKTMAQCPLEERVKAGAALRAAAEQVIGGWIVSGIGGKSKIDEAFAGDLDALADALSEYRSAIHEEYPWVTKDA